MDSPVGALVCPPGIDPEVFAQLPKNMQQEVVSTHGQFETGAPPRKASEAHRYDWSKLVYSQQEVYVGQCTGNHMKRGISVNGMVMLLDIIHWDSYHVAQRDQPLFYDETSNLVWNTGEKNGYDLCEIVIPAYLQKIGLAHLSLVEAIEHGSVAELRPLQAEVGLADVFFSHVQARPLTTMLQSLRQAELMYSVELRRAREGGPHTTAMLRQKALEDFLQEVEPLAAPQVIAAIQSGGFEDPSALSSWLQHKYGRSPDFSLSRPTKSDAEPTYFVDYFCLRQGLGRLVTKGDTKSFDLKQVEDAIKTAGITVAEMRDFGGKNDLAYLRRSFCLLEAFYTIHAKGKLLVCGLPVKHLKLSAIAGADERQRREIVDSSTAKCRSREHKEQIDRFIAESVGFDRLDKLMLGAIVEGYLRAMRTSGEYDQLAMHIADHSDSVEHPREGPKALLRLARTLFDVQAYVPAKMWASDALELQVALYGEGAIETAEYLLQSGECAVWVPANGGHIRAMSSLNSALKLFEEANGTEHISTAHCRVLIGQQLASFSKNQQERLQWCGHGLAIIEQTYGADTIESVDALEQLGTAYTHLGQHDIALDFFERQLCAAESSITTSECTQQMYPAVYEALGFVDQRATDRTRHIHAKIGSALANVGRLHNVCGRYSDALEYQLRALAITDKASGTVGRASAGVSANIGFTYFNQGLIAEAIPYFEQAAAVYEFTYGEDSGMAREYQGVLGEMRQRLAGTWIERGTYHQPLTLVTSLSSRWNLSCS
jgi:tetratricopeptide (TPR) repeat protein